MTVTAFLLGLLILTGLALSAWRRGLMRLSGSDSQRWSNANPEKEHRLQPFGGYLSEFRWFDGFRLPTHVEAGNHIATDQYFPFFVAEVTAVEFPRG